MGKTLTEFARLNVKSIHALPLTPLIQRGNRKLPNTTAIFNMGSASNCPSLKLGYCQAYKGGRHVCYALKAERLWPCVYPYRKRQEKFWKNITAEEFSRQFILINALVNKKYTALRLNEAGDFWNQDSVDKAEKIAYILNKFGIKVYCYTSRRDLDYSKVKHLVISGSNFQKLGIKNIFKTIVNKDDKPKGYGICVGNCRICSRCQNKNMKTVIMSH